jgi:hypothetical protein
MSMNPRARAPQPLAFKLHGQVLADREAVARHNPLQMLAFAASGRDALRIYEHECVEAARKAGATWQEIGDALGMPRQNAQRKYGDPSRKPTWQGTYKPPDN